MKNNFLIFLLIIILIILQLTLLPVIFPSPGTPNLILVFFIAATLLVDFSFVFKWAIIGGLLFDLASYERIGSSAIIFVLAAYLVSFFTRRFSIENRFGGFLIITFLIIVTTFLYRFSVVLTNSYPADLLPYLKNIVFYKNIFKEIIFNSILFIPVFYLIKKIEIKAPDTSFLYKK